MNQNNYETMIICQLANHYFLNEIDEYEQKLDTLANEYEEDPEGELVIGDRETIEQMVQRYICLEMNLNKETQ